jgi:hypothetical protein
MSNENMFLTCGNQWVDRSVTQADVQADVQALHLTAGDGIVVAGSGSSNMYTLSVDPYLYTNASYVSVLQSQVEALELKVNEIQNNHRREMENLVDKLDTYLRLALEGPTGQHSQILYPVKREEQRNVFYINEQDIDPAALKVLMQQIKVEPTAADYDRAMKLVE